MAFANFIRIDTCPAASTRCVNSALSVETDRLSIHRLYYQTERIWHSAYWLIEKNIIYMFEHAHYDGNFALIPKMGLKSSVR